jgi:hypothetical protein
MKRDDRVLFDIAKKRIETSRLDDHSKEGISVALEMSGEACNGMTDAEKMQTMTHALFSLTLAVSYFMAQAPDHTNKCINDAVDAHVGNCAKLMAAQKREKPARPDSGSALSFSFKEGIKAKGTSAIIIAAVLAVVFSLYGIMRWQDSKTQALLKDMFDKKIQQMASPATLSQTTKQGDTP